MRFRAWHASVVGVAVACAVVAGLAWLSFDRMNRLQEETARARHVLCVLLCPSGKLCRSCWIVVVNGRAVGVEIRHQDLKKLPNLVLWHALVRGSHQ